MSSLVFMPNIEADEDDKMVKIGAVVGYVTTSEQIPTDLAKDYLTPDILNSLSEKYLGPLFFSHYGSRLKSAVLMNGEAQTSEFLTLLAESLEENDIVDAYHLGHNMFYERHENDQDWKAWVYEEFGTTPPGNDKVFLQKQKEKRVEAEKVIETIEKNRHKLRLAYSTGCSDKRGKSIMRAMGFRSYVSHVGKSMSPIFVKPFLCKWLNGILLSSAVGYANGVMLKIYMPVYDRVYRHIDPTVTPGGTIAYYYGENITDMLTPNYAEEESCENVYWMDD
ncbi:hypothetical protein ACFL6Y_12035 [Elusimicrobiota bacterium]